MEKKFKYFLTPSQVLEMCFIALFPQQPLGG